MLSSPPRESVRNCNLQHVKSVVEICHLYLQLHLAINLYLAVNVLFVVNTNLGIRIRTGMKLESTLLRYKNKDRDEVREYPS